MTVLALVALALAALPAMLCVANLLALRPPHVRPAPDRLISILIPARNEEGQIATAVECALESQGCAVEVLVADDGSTDRTADIVRTLAARDPRVRLLAVPHLPESWTGKVHACHHLAEAARGSHLLFVDADVRRRRWPGTWSGRGPGSSAPCRARSPARVANSSPCR